MALRAGYYGVKRRIWEALQKTVSDDTQEIENIKKENTVTGVLNMAAPSTVASKTSAGVAYVNTNGVVVANNKATADAYFGWDIGHLPKGKLKLVGCPAGGSATKYCIRLGIGDSASDWGTFVAADYGSGEEFTVTDESKYYSIACRVFTDYTAEDVTFKPMITFDLDATYSDYVPFAMTNQQLTASASDQKTAINAIIAAATGAADFAAFKTAMAAITPVTRSAAPDERPLDVKVEEPVVVKKTTRKKTKTEEEE